MSGFPCRAPWNGAVVHFSGTVYACDQMSQGPEMDAMILGDLNQEDLNTILDGPKARRLRQNLLDGQLEGLMCSTCDKSGSCNLYGDPVSGLESQRLLPDSLISRRMPSADRDSLTRLELALNDLCNMKCVMCAFTKGEASPNGLPKQGHMDLSLVKKALFQAKASSEKPFTVYLHWVGEPLIHPDIKRILRLIHQSGARLHLVTNAIALTEEICHWLFHLTGHHTINFSLNAWTDETFQKVNGSGMRDKVYQNINRFLKLRNDRDAVDKWAVICSAVVVNDNRHEMPLFVKKWGDTFNSFGADWSVSINGKGSQKQNQIMLLREMDHPHADVYFRSVLRRLDLHDSAWPLGPWSVVDSYVLGNHSKEDALESIDLAASIVRPALALKLLRVRGWTDSQLGRLISHCDSMDPHFAPALRKMAMTTRHKFGIQAAQALNQLKLDQRCIPMAMILAPQFGKEWFQALSQCQWKTPQVIRDVAEAISWRIALAEYIPTNWSDLPNTNDASTAIIELAIGSVPEHIQTPSRKQVRYLAKWIYQKDRPKLTVKTLPTIPDCGDLSSAIVLSLNPDNLQKILVASVGRLAESPDWQLRALRRRWLMGGKNQDSPHMQLPLIPISDSRDMEQTLLQLTLSAVSAPSHFNAVISALENGFSPPSRFWQDLAEAVLTRSEIKESIRTNSHEELLSLRRMLGQSTRAKSSHFGLGVGVFLKGMGIVFPLEWSLRHSEGLLLPTWQLEQVQELKGD